MNNANLSNIKKVQVTNLNNVELLDLMFPQSIEINEVPGDWTVLYVCPECSKRGQFRAEVTDIVCHVIMDCPIHSLYDHIG